MRQFIALSLLLLAGNAFAADLYVDPDAKGAADTGDCTATPCVTIQYAIDQATGGDTITVDEGTYDESISVTKNLTFDGDTGGTASKIAPSAGANAISVVDATVTFNDFEVDPNARGFLIGDSTPTRTTVTLNNVDVYGADATGLTPSSGGGMYVYPDCTVNINDSDWGSTANQATSGGHIHVDVQRAVRLNIQARHVDGTA